MINYTSDLLRVSLLPSHLEVSPRNHSMITSRSPVGSVTGKSLKAMCSVGPKEESMGKFPLPVDFIASSRKSLRSGDANLTDITNSYKTHRTRPTISKPAKKSEEKTKFTSKTIRKPKVKPVEEPVKEELKVRTADIQDLLESSVKAQVMQKRQETRQKKEMKQKAEKDKVKLTQKNSEIRKQNFLKFKKEKFQPSKPWGVDQRHLDHAEMTKHREECGKIRHKRRVKRLNALSAGKARIGLDPVLKLQPKNNEFSPPPDDIEKCKTARPNVKSYIKKKNKQKKKLDEEKAIQEEVKESKRIIVLKKLYEKQKVATKKGKSIEKKKKKSSNRSSDPGSIDINVLRNKNKRTDLHSEGIVENDLLTEKFLQRNLLQDEVIDQSMFNEEFLEQNILKDGIPANQDSFSSIESDFDPNSSIYSESFEDENLVIKIQALVRGFLVRRRLQNNPYKISSDSSSMSSRLGFSEEDMQYPLQFKQSSCVLPIQSERNSPQVPKFSQESSVVFMKENVSSVSEAYSGSYVSGEEEDSEPVVLEISEDILNELILEIEKPDLLPISNANLLDIYLEKVFMASDMMADEIQANLEQPIRLNPEEVLLKLQETDIGTPIHLETNSKAPIINLELYLALENARNFSRNATQEMIEASHIQNKLFFDTINECLEKYRPFGVKGYPLPWDRNIPPVGFATCFYNLVKPVVAKELMETTQVQAGIISRGNFNQAIVERVREERMSLMINQEILTKDAYWNDYFLEETQVLLDISDMTLEKLVTEAIELHIHP